MEKVALDVKFDGVTRAMRFASSLTGDEMIARIVADFGLAARSDYVLYLPPGTALGKWLAKSETLSRYLESTDLRAGGAVELRRTPHPMVVHLSGEREMERDDMLAHLHLTKRVVLDLSGSGHDAVREFRILFSSALKQNRNRDEYTLHVSRVREGGDHRLQPLSLARSFWEQNVLPNSVLVLVPTSRLLHFSVKDALSTAMFSGWLAPIKNEGSMTLKKSKPGGSARSGTTKKRLAFYVLRRNLLFAYKSDTKVERAEYVVLLDYYRVEKKTSDNGFVLRFDQKISGFAASSQMVYQLFSASEAEIDGWLRSIALVQKPATDVYGATLRQVANRPSNQHEHCPDFLYDLCDQLKMRIGTDPERYRCLLVADARPPAELTKQLTSAKLPQLQAHPDTAVAAALRSYLSALPEPLSTPGLTEMLQRAHEGGNLKLAASAVALNADLVHAECFRLVLSTLVLAPEAQLAKVSELFAHAIFGANSECVLLLEFLLTHFETVFNNSSLISDVGGAAAKPAPQTLGGTYATVLFKFEGRNVKELSVNAGDAVCIFRESGTGWSQVSRMADGMTGAVPTSYLSPLGSDVPAIGAATTEEVRPPLFSPRAPSEGQDLGRVLTQYESFEARAIQALLAEREAKTRILRMLEQIEANQ